MAAETHTSVVKINGDTTKLDDLSFGSFLERADFQPVSDSTIAALSMPPPSLEKLLKFREACAQAANSDTAHLVPTEEAVKDFAKNLPKIH